MQDARDSYSNDEESKWPGVAHHSRQSSKPLENSVSLNQEEFGSAEAMEYTPSNTSQNNSIPTQLVTLSHSNLNLSQGKVGSFNQGANLNSNSLSPSIYNYSQIEQSLSRTGSFKRQNPNQAQQRLDFSQSIPIGHAIGSNSMTSQEQSIVTQNIQGMSSHPAPNSISRSLTQPHNMGVLEDEFFDQQASLLMQEQRSTPKLIQKKRQNNQQGVPQHQNVPSIDSSSMHQISQSTTPGFQHMSTAQQNHGNGTDQMQSNQSERIQVQNFSINTQNQAHQSQQLQNPPLVTSAARIVPHQTISLHQMPVQAAVVQHADDSLMTKLQSKVREQAQRLQAEAQYRLLCEKRIRKLDPQHPLPLQFEHLERPPFSPPQIQQVYIGKNPATNAQPEQSRQLISHLQARVSELTRQVADRQGLENRLKQTEESLRNEVLQSEEQRAYIEMLKDQIEMKIKTIGLSFDADHSYNTAQNKSLNGTRNVARSDSRQSNGSASSGQVNRSRTSLNKSYSQNRQIDGLLQLTSLQKACEDLKSENDLLKAKLEQSSQTLNSALNEQRDAFQIQLDQLQEQLHHQESKRSELHEKNDTLLEYAKVNIGKNADQEALLVEADRHRRNAQEQASYHQEKAISLELELKSKNSLLEQVKQNLEDMRAEKIKNQAHIQTLTNQKDNLAKKVEEARISVNSELIQKDNQYHELKIEITGLKDRLQIKEDSLKVTEKRLDSLIESEKQLKSQLTSELARAQNVHSQNFSLKHTLVDSQQEMDTLVSKYDQAVEDLIKRDHIISKLTNDLLEAGREAERLHSSNIELKKKADSQENELFDVYSSLRRKEDMLRNLEGGLNRKISEREDQCIALQSKLLQMESNLSAENNTMQQLRRMCEEQAEQNENLQATIHQKEMLLRDMKLQTTQIRLDGEMAYRQREEELLRQIQENSVRELNLTLETEKLRKSKAEVDERTQDAQKMIDMFNKKLSEKDAEIEKLEKTKKRWEEEVKRLDIKAQTANMQQDELQRDYERIKQQQVDDAMLIDRMRVAQGEMKDQVNQIVGRITKFGYHLEEIGQTNLSQDIESAYEISKKIKPGTQDLSPVLDQISNFIKPLSNDIVMRLQNVPERDSDSRSSHRNVDQSRNSSAKIENHTFENYKSHESRNFSGQQQISNFTLMSNKNHQAEQQNIMSTDQYSMADPNASVQSNQRESRHHQVVKATFSNQTSQQVLSIEQSPEYMALKSQITSLEQNQLLDQEEKEDLEQAFRVMLQISTLSNPIRLLLQELSLRIRDTNQARREKYTQATRLLQMEQSYHYQSKLALSNSLQIELTLLKQGIVRERQRLHELDITLVGNTTKQTRIIEDILRTNAFAVDQNAEISLKIKKLQELYEEANIQRQEVTEKLEWTQTLLNEQRSLRNRFMPREASAEPKQKRASPSRDNSAEPSRLTSAAVTGTRVKSQSINEDSEESAYNQSKFKNYLPPILNGKTDKQLKSEEFNRKQIINSARDQPFREYIQTSLEDEGNEVKNEELAHPQRINFVETSQESPNRAEENHVEAKNQQRSISPSDFADRALRNRIRQNSASQVRAHSRGDGSTSQLRDRSRDGSASQDRSKSPTLSQASDIIRRKYSQIRNSSRPQEENVYGSRVESPRVFDHSERQPQLTVAQLQHTRPLRRSPQRAIRQYGSDSPEAKRTLHGSRSPGQRAHDQLNDMAVNQFKRF